MCWFWTLSWDLIVSFPNFSAWPRLVMKICTTLWFTRKKVFYSPVCFHQHFKSVLQFLSLWWHCWACYQVCQVTDGCWVGSKGVDESDMVDTLLLGFRVEIWVELKGEVAAEKSGSFGGRDVSNPHSFRFGIICKSKKRCKEIEKGASDEKCWLGRQ